jgi:hypothetical protein
MTCDTEQRKNRGNVFVSSPDTPRTPLNVSSASTNSTSFYRPAQNTLDRRFGGAGRKRKGKARQSKRAGKRSATSFEIAFHKTPDWAHARTNETKRNDFLLLAIVQHVSKNPPAPCLPGAPRLRGSI